MGPGGQQRRTEPISTPHTTHVGYLRKVGLELEDSVVVLDGLPRPTHGQINGCPPHEVHVLLRREPCRQHYHAMCTARRVVVFEGPGELARMEGLIALLQMLFQGQVRRH
jgi:hypothetical protein